MPTLTFKPCAIWRAHYGGVFHALVIAINFLMQEAIIGLSSLRLQTRCDGSSDLR
jgi:hypothetical protein